MTVYDGRRIYSLQFNFYCITLCFFICLVIFHTNNVKIYAFLTIFYQIIHFLFVFNVNLPEKALGV